MAGHTRNRGFESSFDEFGYTVSDMFVTPSIL